MSKDLQPMRSVILRLVLGTVFFCIFVAYLSSYHEKAINALHELT